MNSIFYVNQAYIIQMLLFTMQVIVLFIINQTKLNAKANIQRLL